MADGKISQETKMAHDKIGSQNVRLFYIMVLYYNEIYTRVRDMFKSRPFHFALMA